MGGSGGVTDRHGVSWVDNESISKLTVMVAQGSECTQNYGTVHFTFYTLYMGELYDR